MKPKIQQPPIRNASSIGVSVYSHSGEFAPSYTDLQLPGRGLDLQFTRSYRSSFANYVGELGRGWFSSIAKRIERKGDDIIYQNGAGEVYRFLGGINGSYTSPTGFYGILLEEEGQFVIHRRYGLKYRFEIPEQGGRILNIEDRNQNSLEFSYSANRIFIIDTLKRKSVMLIHDGIVQELQDHAGRKWEYTYDENSHLIKITQPATTDFPNGTSIKYAYDSNHRLISITDAKDQKYLVNFYDESGKIMTQEHGSGVFKMEYEVIGERRGGFLTYRTTCIRKNGSKLVLEHNPAGNVISRILYVRKESFAEQDVTDTIGDNVPLITNSIYNKNLELTSRIFPAGNKTEWVYSEKEKDPRNQGNLLRVIQIPQAEVETDQSQIVTEYEYEQTFQLRMTLIDPRGNKTFYEYDEKGNLIVTTYPSVTIQPVNSGSPRPTPFSRVQSDEYQYNSKGQLLRRKHIDGSITEYHYYPVDDPIGVRGLNIATDNPDQICGYLARIVRDANGKRLKNEYAYDIWGNVTTVLDGKGNPVRLKYNAMGKMEGVTSREPFKYRIDYKYDANYNEIEASELFERLQYDETNQTTKITSSILRELKEYNALDNVTQRKIVGDDKIIIEYFVRDADEKIIRQIQPLGNATEYIYDERNRIIEKKFGVGTRAAFATRYTYTLNGAVRTSINGNGNTTTHYYDGFHRYKGFINPMGTKKTQWFDEGSNVVRVEVNGDNGLTKKRSESRHRRSASLMAAEYHYDQWNRVYRIDKGWHSPSNKALGKSQWSGEKGIVSTVLEYAENGLPGKVWMETDNVVGIEYDGIRRIVQMKDLTGEEFSFEYDENNNLTLLAYLGPEVDGRAFEQVYRRNYDEMDRLICQQANDETPERFIYNALGNLINYVGKSGIEIHFTDDSLGRRVGHAFTITDKLDNTKIQKIVRRFEYDDNYRLSAYTDASGKRTMYLYDTLNRQTGVVFPDGSSANVEYDASGNVVRIVDQNNNETCHRYDAAKRLIGRQSYIKAADKTIIEQYEYDGLNRLLTTIAPDATLRRTYDSLSRLLSEQQGDHVLHCEYDSAGNLTSLLYPGGEEVHKAYDIRQRVISVKNKTGDNIASFIYRANDQITTMLLGNVIEADFLYDQRQNLESIEYKRTDNHDLVEGFRYQYDDTGRMTCAIQLSVSSTYGERYYYDDANRAIKAQYGVQDVLDPNSPFEQETSYEHFPEGSWQQRLDVDGQGQVIDEQTGTINQLNNYKQFGNFAFTYDANGNCIRRTKSNFGNCDYTYDQDNRLIKSECHDSAGNTIQTIEYFYDSLGRQVRKVVTDQSGNKTETTYVWVGNVLLEEYENGILVRTYIYGIDWMPVQLSVTSNGRSDYFYILDGKERVVGLLDKFDPARFAEKYAHELPGASFVKEIDGVSVDIFSRKSTRSDMLNSILSGGWYIRDWENGTNSRLGRHGSPEINSIMNSRKGHGGVPGLSDFVKEMNATLDRFNQRGPSFFPIRSSDKGNSGLDGINMPNSSRYGQSDNPIESQANRFKKYIPVVGDFRIIVYPIWSLDPPPDRSIQEQINQKEAQDQAKEDEEKRAEEAGKKIDEAIARMKEQAEKEEQKKEEYKKKAKELGDYPTPSDEGNDSTAYGRSNPDSDYTGISFLSPQDIERILFIRTQGDRIFTAPGGDSDGSEGDLTLDPRYTNPWDPIARYTEDGGYEVPGYFNPYFNVSGSEPMPYPPGPGSPDDPGSSSPSDVPRTGGINPVARPLP